VALATGARVCPSQGGHHFAHLGVVKPAQLIAVWASPHVLVELKIPWNARSFEVWAGARGATELGTERACLLEVPQGGARAVEMSSRKTQREDGSSKSGKQRVPRDA
jgi:hypothetical protein